MKGFEEIHNFFEKELRKEKINDKPLELYEPIRYTIDLGGKRIRPIMCLMACEMFGIDCHKALDPAIAIEYFHNFTLIHDDIMDKALIRRGSNPVYRKWNENIAILAGDTLFALAYQYAQKVDRDIMPKILTIFSKTAIEVCEGQQFDLNFEDKSQVSVEEYLSMIRKKTSVLFGASVKIGAEIAGASEEDVNQLYDFGVNIGMGFQLMDDLLDIFGDETVFGKKTGADIRSNKKTYLYLKALELADETQRTELIDLYCNNKHCGSQEKVDQVTNFFVQLNVKESVKKRINFYYQQALTNLDQINVDKHLKKNFESLALKMIDREN